MQSSGSGGGLAPLVNFYSKLPKGPAPSSAAGGIKGRFFNGKNASASPVVWTILGLFGLGYTIDYQSELHPYHARTQLIVDCLRSAPQYVPLNHVPVSKLTAPLQSTIRTTHTSRASEGGVEMGCT